MNEEEKTSDFDFDLWSKMAQEEPEKFELMRQQLIDDLIAQAPEHFKPRMIGLQWQVDQVRKQAINPMATCSQISRKMWNNVLGENGLLNALQEPKKILSTLEKAPAGKILSFERPKSGK
ncbi:DUF3135 domain-containing protein [Nitrosomonas sp.]|uniref:DUF3135 domain-containing protein n=1 Tax=Nitrosomonas sp. TaxID=42353 RepID=UPI00374D5000